MHNAEDRSIRANPKRDGNDGQQRETGLPDETAKSVAYVSHCGVLLDAWRRPPVSR
jgi:hypothetical protein